MKEDSNMVRVRILTAIVIICFFMICLVNFSAVPSFYDADMYCDYKYAIEVWNHKSIFPEGWVFGNQLNAVSTPVLAALFYGFSGNMNFSMGAACTIMAVLVLYCYDWMLKAVVKGIESRCIAIVLLLTFTLFGGTATSGRDGWSLLFTMCSYYAGYSITAFLAFGCYLRALTGFFDKHTAVLVLTCVLSFGTGIQSIRQTTIMVAPMLAVEFLRMMVSHKAWKENRKPLWTAVVIAVANFLGLFYIRIKQVNQNQIFGTIALTPLTELAEAIKESILNLLILVGSDHPENSVVIWSAGIICTGALIIMLRNWKREKADGHIALALLMGLSVLIVAAIDIFTTMLGRPRYFFVIYPLMGFLLAYLHGHVNKRLQLGLVALMIVFFGITAIHEFPEVCVSTIKNKEEESHEISTYLLENGYTTVYALWEQGNDVAIASNGKIDVGYWHTEEETFEKITYLCNLDTYNADPNSCVYFFRGRESAQIGIDKAESRGVELEFLRHYPESDTYIYTASTNLMQHDR